MTMTNVRPFVMCPLPISLFADYAFAQASITLDSTSDYLAPHFFCQDAATIDRFEFVVNSITGAGDIKVQIYTLSTSGVPTTPVGSEVTIATGSTGRKVATGLNASCSADTLYCVRITVTASTNIAIRVSVASVNNNKTSPYGYSYNTSGSDVVQADNGGLMFAVGTSSGFDGKFNPLMTGAIIATGTQSVASNATVHAGNKWVPQAPMRVWGLWMHTVTGQQGDFDVILSNAAGDVLATGTVDVSQSRVNGNAYQVMVAFNSPYDVVAGTTYYLLVKGLTTTSWGVNQFQYGSNDSLATLLGTTYHRVTAATLGTYTESTDYMLLLFPYISGVDNGVGGGTTLVLNSRATSHLRR